MIDYNYALEKLRDAVQFLLNLDMNEVEKIVLALNEMLLAERHINDERSRDIIDEIKSKIGGEPFPDSVEKMTQEKRQEIVNLIFELYEVVAEHYYKNYYTNR